VQLSRCNDVLIRHVIEKCAAVFPRRESHCVPRHESSDHEADLAESKVLAWARIAACYERTSVMRRGAET
jgi:hypothetical protein